MKFATPTQNQAKSVWKSFRPNEEDFRILQTKPSLVSLNNWGLLNSPRIRKIKKRGEGEEMVIEWTIEVIKLRLRLR